MLKKKKTKANNTKSKQYVMILKVKRYVKEKGALI